MEYFRYTWYSLYNRMKLSVRSATTSAMTITRQHRLMVFLPKHPTDRQWPCNTYKSFVFFFYFWARTHQRGTIKNDRSEMFAPLRGIYAWVDLAATAFVYVCMYVTMLLRRILNTNSRIDHIKTNAITRRIISWIVNVLAIGLLCARRIKVFRSENIKMYWWLIFVRSSLELRWFRKWISKLFVCFYFPLDEQKN